MRPTTIAKYLDRAADIIEERGWARGKFVNRRTGAVCSLEAIRRAAPSKRARDEMRWALMKEIERPDGKPASVMYWNDRLPNNRRKVVRTFRRTARKLRGAKR